MLNQLLLFYAVMVKPKVTTCRLILSSFRFVFFFVEATMFIGKLFKIVKKTLKRHHAEKRCCCSIEKKTGIKKVHWLFCWLYDI